VSLSDRLRAGAEAMRLAYGSSEIPDRATTVTVWGLIALWRYPERTLIPMNHSEKINELVYDTAGPHRGEQR